MFELRLSGLVTFENGRGTLRPMSDERDWLKLGLDRSSLQDGDSLAQCILALNQKLLAEYIKRLRSESWQVRVKSAHGLGFLKGVAAPAISSLEELLRDNDHRVRRAAALALASIRTAS
jgi:HEAT repeat protein